MKWPQKLWPHVGNLASHDHYLVLDDRDQMPTKQKMIKKNQPCEVDLNQPPDEW